MLNAQYSDALKHLDNRKVLGCKSEYIASAFRINKKGAQ